MEFHFDVDALFPETITRTVGAKLPPSWQLTADGARERFATVVNEMGLASAKAQGLRCPITSYQKLAASNQTLYIMKEQESSNNGKGVIVGLLKTGEKKLFLADPRGVQREVHPLCVLDFYVHETKQRCGYGKTLFEAMLKAENLKPFEIAIDRPSPKFLGFLRKHYKLQSYVRQANNYVVFDQFFTTCTDVSNKSRRCLQHNLTSLSPTRKSPTDSSLLSQNSTSVLRLTDSTANVEETKDHFTDNNGRYLNGKPGSPNSKRVHGVLSQSTNHGTSPLAIGVPSDFTWTQQTYNRGFVKHQSRERFNIISGHPLHQETNHTRAKHGSRPICTSLTNKSMDTNGVNSNGNIPTGPTANFDNACTSNSTFVQQQVQKAPHLDVRQIGSNKPQKKSYFSGLSTYRASFKPTAGFHSKNSLGPVVQNAASQWDTLTYSRHSIPQTSKSAPQIGSFATSIGSGTSLLRPQGISSPSRNSSAYKLKDEWKSFIL